jgi:cyanophycin synthetase
MKVSRVRALRGPNLWTRHTALELVVELPPDERSIDAMHRYEARLRARFPALGPIRPVGYRGELPLACALEFALLRLQSEAGCAVTFSHTAPALEEGIYRVVVEYTQERSNCTAPPWLMSPSTWRVSWRNCARWTRTSASGPAPPPS